MRESLDEVIADAEIVMISKRDKEYLRGIARLPAGTAILDLVRLTSDVRAMPDKYEGLSW
jgi:hypothetical protein